MIGERTHVSTQGRCEVPCTGLVAARCLVGGVSPIDSMYMILERERERDFDSFPNSTKKFSNLIGSHTVDLKKGSYIRMNECK